MEIGPLNNFLGFDVLKRISFKRSYNPHLLDFLNGFGNKSYKLQSTK